MSTPTDSTSDASAAPVDDQSSTGARRSRSGRPARSQAPRQRRGPRLLIDTAGPAPDAELAAIKLTIGVIAGTHGVDGELKLKVLTDHPEHLPRIREVFLGESDAPTQVLGFRMHGDQGLIRLAGTDNPEDGKRLGGLRVRIRGTDAAPLAPGEYFLFQLIGLKVESPTGEPLGEVVDLIETGANDVLVITDPAGAEVLVPNHPAYVHEILPTEGRLVLELPVYRD